MFEGLLILYHERLMTIEDVFVTDYLFDNLSLSDD